MIHIEELHKSFNFQQQTLPIIHITKWSVKQGDQIAILGPSGSGKSTLLHLIGGVLTHDSGHIEVAGQLISHTTEAERDRFRATTIGYVFQDFHLIPSLTAKQNIELVMPRSLTSKNKSKLLSQWFERVGLANQMNQRPSQLSRGQQQRVAIIRALINRPPLILADEPTGSLDWETASSVMKLLLEICTENGSTLLTVTHDRHLAQLYPSTVQMEELNKVMQRQHAGRVGGMSS